MSKRSYLKQAEQNVLNLAKAWDDATKLTDGLANFGNRMCHDYIGREKFFKGLKLLREAMYEEQAAALRNCFVLAGVGGKEAREYSRQLFKEIFCSGEYSIMQFLDKWGQHPSWYHSEVEEEFRKECQDAIKKETIQGEQE